MKVQAEEMFPWEFSQALNRAPVGYLPLGTLEWHGEHNAIGLDALKAHALCVAAAQQSGGIVLPALYWAADTREDLPDGSYLTGGVEAGERYHAPGNMFWLRPDTFYNLLLDNYEAMRRRGFRVLLVVTGHWSHAGNLPVIRQSGEDFQARHPEVRWAMLTDLEMADGLHYPHEHAAGGETSLLMAIRPELVDLTRTFETARSLRPFYAGQQEHLERRERTGHKYIGVLTGEPDGANDPELTANPGRGRELFEAISSRIAARARALLAEIPAEQADPGLS